MKKENKPVYAQVAAMLAICSLETNSQKFSVRSSSFFLLVVFVFWLGRLCFSVRSSLFFG